MNCTVLLEVVQVIYTSKAIMPYEIQMDNEDCQGHAVVKLDDGQYYGLPRNTRRS